MKPDLDNNCKWYALYTKSRHEKFIETEFLKKGIEAFTPKITFKKKWSDRTKLIEEPLFKSYCFARFGLENRIDIVSQKGVVNVVHFNNHYIPIEESVINSLRILTENKIMLDPYPYLEAGKRVIIKRGPLKGLEGFILEKRNRNTTLVISVEALFSSVKCVVDVDFVELV
ncbi:MAG: UpxY family transcription antiterminator [Candidatus Omnitrophica bacterium]|nr:UpxY family transcription antiterminator [Candidatus Omnitrophota bacterium]